MSEFVKSWPVIEDHEGTKYSNHAWDPGGATKYGITLRSAKAAQGIDFDADHDGDIDEKDIQLMDECTAFKFYHQWWERYHYGNVVDQTVATKVMDMSINMGPKGVSQKTGQIFGAHAMVQNAVNRCGYDLVVDGNLGPKSFEAINECSARELLMELCFLQTEHYRKWCDADPSREVAREGLHHRAAWPFVENGYLV